MRQHVANRTPAGSMFTMLTVIRKRPEVSTEQFRHFMEFEYGPTYAALPQTREYVQGRIRLTRPSRHSGKPWPVCVVGAAWFE
jgi:hypothetical protein